MRGSPRLPMMSHLRRRLLHQGVSAKQSSTSNSGYRKEMTLPHQLVLTTLTDVTRSQASIIYPQYRIPLPWTELTLEVVEQSNKYRTKVQCGRSKNMIAFNKGISCLPVKHRRIACTFFHRWGPSRSSPQGTAQLQGHRWRAPNRTGCSLKQGGGYLQ